jgi:hypothetical protein
MKKVMFGLLGLVCVGCLGGCYGSTEVVYGGYCPPPPRTVIIYHDYPHYHVWRHGCR